MRKIINVEMLGHAIASAEDTRLLGGSGSMVPSILPSPRNFISF